jgi:transcriptional regulator with XRE-family HTH domain
MGRKMHIMHWPVKRHDACRAFAQSMPVMHPAHMKLPEIRRQRGLSQKQLAAITGVDQATIHRAEKMHHSAKLATYQLCAQALDVTLVDIFSDDRTETERRLLRGFRSMPDNLQRVVLDLAASVLSEEGSDATGTKPVADRPSSVPNA